MCTSSTVEHGVMWCVISRLQGSLAYHWVQGNILWSRQLLTQGVPVLLLPFHTREELLRMAANLDSRFRPYVICSGRAPDGVGF